MAEDIGALSVTLSLNSDNFTKGMQSIERQMKANDEAFKASVAESGNLGTSLENLGNKQQYLQTKLENQQTALSKYGEKLADLKEKYAGLAQVQQELPEKVKAAEQAWKNSEAALKEHTKAMGKDADSTKELEQETKRLKAEYDDLNGKQDANGRAMDSVQRQTEQTTIAYQKLRGELALTKNELNELSAEKFLKVGQTLEKAGQSIGHLGGTLTRAVTLPLVGLGTLAVKSAIDFESAFAGVRKTVNATEAQFAKMEEEILSLSGQMPFAATEIAGVAEAAGQLGIKTEDIMSFTETMLKLGQATNMTAEDAATQLARFANITGLTAGEYDKLGSSIVELGNNMATTEAEIVAMGMRLASAGTMVGMSESEIMAFSAALSSLGIEAEAGGTAFSKAMLKIDGAVRDGGKSVKEFAKVAGMSAKEFSDLWGRDAASAMNAFLGGLGKIKDSGGNLAGTIEGLLGSEVRLRDTMMRAASGSELVAEAVNMSNRAWNENIALTEEADKRNATMESRLSMLGNQLKNTGMQFGEALMPVLEKGMTFVGGLVEKFASMDDGMRNSVLFSAGAAALAGPTLKVLGGATEGIGKISTAIGNLKKGEGVLSAVLKNAFSPTGLAIGATVAAVGGLILLMGDAERQAQKMREAIQNMELNLDEESIEQIRESIREGVEAGEIYANATISAKAELSKVEVEVDKAFEDGTVTNKEAKKIAKAMNTVVDTAIKEAQKYLDDETAKYVSYITSFTVGNASEVSGSDYAFVTEVEGIVSGMGTKLKGVLPMLTEDEISTIVTVAISTPAEDLEQALKDAGFIDAETVQTIVSTVQTDVSTINNIFKNLGIADEYTQAAMVGMITVNMTQLRQKLAKAGVIDTAGQTEIINALSGSFATMKAGVIALKETEGFNLTDTQINDLVTAWIGGPEKWNAELKKQKITDDSTKGALEEVLGGFGDPLSGVDLAGANRETVVAAWAGQFSTMLTDAANQTLLSKETIDGMTAKFQEETNGMIAQIDSYRTEFNDLVAKISQNGYTASDAERLRMQELIGKVAELRTELGLLGDETYQRARASETLVMAGRGTKEDFGAAVGMQKETLARREVEIKALSTEAITLANNAVDESRVALEAAKQNLAEVAGTDLEAAVQAEVSKAQAEYEAAIAFLESQRTGETESIQQAKEDAAGKISELFNAMAAQYPEEAEKFTAVIEQYDMMKLIGDTLTGADLSKEQFDSVFTPDVLQGLLDMPGLTEADMASMFTDGKINELGLEYLDQVKEKLAESFEGGMEGLAAEENPLLEMLKSMTEEGVFTEEALGDIDLSAFDGALKNAILAMDIKSLGGAVPEGMGEGIKASETLATDAVTGMCTAMETATRTALDSHSPSKKYEAFGKGLPAGMGIGISASSQLALAPLRALMAQTTAAGADFVQGIINGVNSKTGALYAAIKTMAEEMMNALKTGLQIQSPSLKAEWAGEMFGAGLERGVEKKIADVAGAVERMAEAMELDVTGGDDAGTGSRRGGRGDVNQTVNIYSPKQPSLSEMARMMRYTAQRLALER